MKKNKKELFNGTGDYIFAGKWWGDSDGFSLTTYVDKKGNSHQVYTNHKSKRSIYFTNGKRVKKFYLLDKFNIKD